MVTRFIIGGLIYIGIEVMYDNTSHRSMGLVGGVAFVLCSWYISFGLNHVILSLLMSTTITALEYIAGMIFNRDYSIWDYRKLPFNINGQVCLPFMLIWAVIMPFVIIWLDGLLPKM